MLVGGGNGRCLGGRKAAARPGIIILGGAVSQKGTLGGCCHLDLPLGELHRDVVRIRWLKAF